MPCDVSTLLEILQGWRPVSETPKFVKLFQPFLRFYIRRMEEKEPRRLLCPFQPFLRFYGKTALEYILTDEQIVSTLLEILHRNGHTPVHYAAWRCRFNPS